MSVHVCLCGEVAFDVSVSSCMQARLMLRCHANYFVFCTGTHICMHMCTHACMHAHIQYAHTNVLHTLTPQFSVIVATDPSSTSTVVKLLPKGPDEMDAQHKSDTSKPHGGQEVLQGVVISDHYSRWMWS